MLQEPLCHRSCGKSHFAERQLLGLEHIVNLLGRAADMHRYSSIAQAHMHFLLCLGKNAAGSFQLDADAAGVVKNQNIRESGFET